MTTQRVRDYLKQFGRDQDVLEFDQPSATVELAAQVLNVEPGKIAKTLSFYDSDKTKCIIVVMSGDKRADNSKFKKQFNVRLRMLQAGDIENLTGYAPGGVCPFANPDFARVYLDISLKRYDTVYPACGTANSAIELSIADLENYSKSLGWIDVSK